MCCAMMECHFVTVFVVHVEEVGKVELHLTRVSVTEKASGECTPRIVCNFPADFVSGDEVDFIKTYHERRLELLT